MIALHAGSAHAEAVVRKPAETDDSFMSRVAGKSGDLAQKVVRSNEIAAGKVALIGFVSTSENSLVGHLLIETSADHYEHASFPSCDEEGGAPELLAVFFARTVKGGQRDLAVLCAWEHGGQAVNGTAYAAEFYRVDASRPTVTVRSLTDLNGKFNTADMVEVNQHGKWIRTGKAKFKTAAEVKRLLTKMDVPQ